MSLQERIDADIKAAMLAREKDSLNALRSIKSAIILELTREGGQAVLDETTGIKILQKLLKQRMESASIYNAQDREELAREEEAQALVIERYLPKRMSRAETEKILRVVITEIGANKMADMGRVMGEANKRLAGKADGAVIAEIVKDVLANG